MGDEIATTETLLAVRRLHACHASTRAPESESDNEKKPWMRMEEGAIGHYRKYLR